MSTDSNQSDTSTTHDCGSECTQRDAVRGIRKQLIIHHSDHDGPSTRTPRHDHTGPFRSILRDVSRMHVWMYTMEIISRGAMMRKGQNGGGDFS